MNERAKVVEFAQSTLRALAAFYVMSRYPRILSEERGFAPAPKLLEAPLMVNVKGFIQQVSNKL